MQQASEHQVSVLLAVWGEKFIEDFLQLSLSSLLAPGNIPALASNYKTKFVFLTRTQDLPVFEANPAFLKLKNICEIEFIDIRDLIVFGNYSTTLTLAYDRAIKLTGEQMLNTYFVFLTSDYIMADGSMEGLMRYIKKGYSGICAGNFQVIEEDIKTFFLNNINKETHVLQMGPRELIKQSMPYLHPVTVASLFEQNMTHNYRANRFFYRLDSQVLAGRFYLLHMLCIKPETMDYQIGSSCDYSFIPAMCPSGNVGIINDSDDYLVVEIQTKYHELDLVNWGGYNIKKLAMALSEWTTKQHRANANQTIYYHSRDLTEQDKEIVETHLANFIGSVSKRLQKYKEQPHYNHPYWYGAVESFEKQKKILQNANDYDYLDFSLFNPTFAKKMFYHFFGLPPNVFPWHYRNLEYRVVMNAIKRNIAKTKPQNTIVFYDTYQGIFMRYRAWFEKKLLIPHHYYARNLKSCANKLKELQSNPFECCILMVRVDELAKITYALSLIRKVLKPGGKVLVIIPNDRNHFSKAAYNFRDEFAYRMNVMAGADFHIANVKPIFNNLTYLGASCIHQINKYFSYSRKIRFIFYLLVGLPGSVLCFIRNCLPKLFNSKSGHCTNILVTLVTERKMGNEYNK